MQIVPGLYRLGDSSGGEVRSYLIDDGGELMLIDTLLDNDGSLVLEELKKLGRQPGDIKKIILTHAHQSHYGGLAALKRATGALVYSHDFEAPILQGKKQAPVPPTTTLIPQRPFSLYKYQAAFVLHLKIPPPCPVDQTLKDGDRVGPLTVLHTPGHTAGSLSFYWPEKRALIAGDIVTTWPELALGWPMITMDNAQNRNSVGKLCDMVQADVLCVGHGEPVVQGAADFMRDLVAGKQTQPALLKASAAGA